MDLSSPFTSYLNTNYIPSSTEISQIKELLIDGEIHLSKLDTEVDRLQKTLDKLIIERGAVKSHLESHRALLSPIRRLPPETLGEIFVRCLPTQGYPVRSVTEAPLLLARICRGWREVALSTPRLWCALHIYIPGLRTLTEMQTSLDQRLEGIKLWLNRSQSLPLSLSLAIAPDFGIFAGVGIEDYSQHLDVAMFYASLCHRWREIQFNVPSEILDAFTHLKGHDVPLLEKLLIKFRSQWGPWQENGTPDTPLQMKDLIATAPNLHKVHILSHKHKLSAFPLAWNNLTEMILHLEHINMLGTSEALDILVQSPMLRHCALGIVFRSPEETRPAHVQAHLPFLHTLAISFSYPRISNENLPEDYDILECLKEVFDNLLVPALVDLSVTLPFYGLITPGQVFSRPDALDHVPFLSLPLHQLHTLTIKLPISCNAMIECLRLMPVLRRLDVKVDEISRDTLEPSEYCFSGIHLGLLSSANDFGLTLCPLLEQISLRNCRAVTDEALSQFLEAKLLVEGFDANGSCANRLNSLEATFPRAVTSSQRDRFRSRITFLKEKGIRVRLNYRSSPGHSEDLPRAGLLNSNSGLYDSPPPLPPVPPYSLDEIS